MVVGIRVVRGPDWNKGNQDGGQDHVGTVSRVINDNSVKVVWDMGETTTCRVGDDGKHDIIVFDSAPLGLSHPNVGCESCEEICITGTLWKCRTCANVNLCTACYYGDGHIISHPFNRIDLPGSEPVEVPKRSSSQKSRSLGLYPSAQVVRGKDWEYMDQDGGNGKIGVIEDVICFGLDVSNRNAVRVRWPNNTSNSYRVGYMGKVDLRCTEESAGPDFYKDHLAKIDLSKLIKKQAGTNILAAGDRVCVHVSASELRNLQQGRLQWNTRLEEVVGEIGILKRTTIEGNVEVDFDGELLILNKAAVQKVPEFKKGDMVRAISSKEIMIRLQRYHGGWDDDMVQILGKSGVVTVVDKDGDVGVKFEESGFVFHPNCLILVSREQQDRIELEDSDDNGDEEAQDIFDGEDGEEPNVDEDGASNVGDGFLQMFAGLVLLQALADTTQPESDNKERFLNAVINGRESDVQEMLKQDPNLCNLTHRGLPTLHLAAHQGHTSVVVILLDAGISIDIRDAEKKNTALIVAIASALDKILTKNKNLINSKASNGFVPLHIAAINNHVNEATTLIIKGNADVNALNDDKTTPLHLACFEAHFDMVKILLTYGADFNLKDKDGDTALHLCMAGRKSGGMFLAMLGLRNLAEDNERIKIADFMIQHGAKIDVVNVQGKTPITICTNERMKEAVTVFAAKNTPTKPDKPKARPRTAKVEQEAFTTFNQKCHKCTTNMSDTRFLPCKHTVSCVKCCFKFKRCPICDKEIGSRVDKGDYIVHVDVPVLKGRKCLYRV